MERWDDLSGVPAGAGPSVLTLGNFDGVHAGHREVLSRVVGRARARGALAVAITFDPHPLHVLHPDRAPALLTGLDHRLELMAATGLDATLVMRFTRELASWTPEEFVTRVLVDRLGVVEVVVGRDVRFGRRNSGDLSTLIELGDQHGFGVVALDDVTDPGDRRWSSSWLRQLLADGDVTGAARVLGRSHRVTGEVVHGDHRGRELGYPTANLGAHDVNGPGAAGLVPADGVSAGWLVRPEHAGARLPAAISVGTNPTFDGVDRRVEAYVLDRTDLDLYGERVAVEFVERLRPTVRFTGVDDLVTQMGHDVVRCREVLAAVGTARDDTR